MRTRIAAVVGVAVALTITACAEPGSNRRSQSARNPTQAGTTGSTQWQQELAERRAAIERTARQESPEEAQARRDRQREEAIAAATAQQEANRPALELGDFRGTIGEYGYSTVEGRVTNISDAPLRNVMAVVTWYTEDGQFVTSDDALIEYDPILAGQTSPFEVMSRTNPAMKRFRVEFKELFGGTIRTRRAAD